MLARASGPTLAALIMGSAATLVGIPTARANPRPLPYTYIYETLPRGEAELEQYADLTPLRAVNLSDGSPTSYLASQFQTEFEYGLTDHLELGLYVTMAVPISGLQDAPNMPEGTGIKQRLRYRFAEAGQWPVDLAVYGEVTENEREVELEGKIIFQRRVGPLRLAANAWVDREFYYAGAREWVLNPTAGAVLEKWVTVQPGIEYWMSAEHRDGVGWVGGTPHYLGPTVIFQFGRIWWSNGVYANVGNLQTPALGSGSPYGALWFRTVIGISL